jgi:mycothiol synthase
MVSTRQMADAAPKARPLRDERDWWRVRTLLVATHATVRPGWNWDIRRWDGWRFHAEEPVSQEGLARVVGLWETPDGRLRGAVHPESPGEAYLQLDPDFRHLEPAMVAWAEEHLATTTGADHGRSLTLYVDDVDEPRRWALAERGYVMANAGGWLRWLRLDDRPPQVPPLLPGGYRLRPTEGTDGDCARMAALLNAAFGRTVHTAREYRTFMDRSPAFEHELNLVVVAPDGSFAAHAGFTYDHDNRHGIVEPVCTHPDHRRLNLARTLILEGVHRVAARGARTASLDTGEGLAANALYAGCGFTTAHHVHPWRRDL